VWGIPDGKTMGSASGEDMTQAHIDAIDAIIATGLFGGWRSARMLDVDPECLERFRVRSDQVPGC